MDREKKTCNIIDIAVPVDAGIVEKEKEKAEKYQDVRREVARLWNVKAKVVPIVVGAQGAVTPNLSKHLDAIGVTTRIQLLQKAALLLIIEGRFIRLKSRLHRRFLSWKLEPVFVAHRRVLNPLRLNRYLFLSNPVCSTPEQQ